MNIKPRFTTYIVSEFMGYWLAFMTSAVLIAIIEKEMVVALITALILSQWVCRLLIGNRWKENLARDIATGIMASIVVAFSLNPPQKGYFLVVALGVVSGIFDKVVVKHVPSP